MKHQNYNRYDLDNGTSLLTHVEVSFAGKRAKNALRNLSNVVSFFFLGGGWLFDSLAVQVSSV